MSNFEQLGKNVGKHYRIQPWLLEFNDAGARRGFLDDAWTLKGVTADSFTLGHRELGLSITLGRNAYAGFDKHDPDRDAELQAEGVLVLKAQVYQYQGALGCVYTKEPGRQHSDFRPPAVKATLADVVRADNVRKDFERRQQQFLADGKSLGDALRSLNAIPDMLKEHVAELNGKGLEIDVRTHTHVDHFGIQAHAIWCNGWWFTMMLSMAGSVESLELNIVKWVLVPRFPKFRSFGEEKVSQRWVRQYRLTEDGPRWVGAGLSPHTERELAEWLLMLAIQARGGASKD